MTDGDKKKKDKGIQQEWLFSLRSFVGGRVLKTGVAVYLVALICQTLNIPVFYPVIAAIVTVEPTVADSLRKGLVRFPAAAIGAGYALFFAFLLGQTALAFALAAVLTIFTIYRLRWPEAVLVATLTATAMIPETDGNFLIAFFTRLGGTLLGITVSSLVNFAIIPPRFSVLVQRRLQSLQNRLAELLQECLGEESSSRRRGGLEKKIESLRWEIERGIVFLRFQKEEWVYRRHTRAEMRRWWEIHHQLMFLHRFLYHLENAVLLYATPVQAAAEERIHKVAELLVEGVQKLPPWEDPTDEEKSVPVLLECRRRLGQEVKWMKQALVEEQQQEDELSSSAFRLYEVIAMAQLLRGYVKRRHGISASLSDSKAGGSGFHLV